MRARQLTDTLVEVLTTEPLTGLAAMVAALDEAAEAEDVWAAFDVSPGAVEGAREGLATLARAFEVRCARGRGIA